MGLNEQTLRNWIKAADAGKLAKASDKAITPEQMELYRLRAENIRHKRECEILKIGEVYVERVLCKGSAVKYAWVDKQRGFALAEMCEILDVSVSGYRAWKRGGKPERKRLTDPQMLALIQSAFSRGVIRTRSFRSIRVRPGPMKKE